MSNLTRDLALLETRGLMRVTTDRDKPVVRFKHALTREATYNSILQSRRNELHCAVAQTLLQFHQQLDLELVLSIAEHQLRCGDDAGMVDFLLPFAQRLIHTGRSLSLTELFSRLNRAELSTTQQRDLDIALADTHAARGEYEAARGLYELVLTKTEPATLRARLLQSLGVANYHLGEYAKSMEFYQASLDTAQSQGNIALQAKTSGGLGLVHLALGDTARALEFLQTSRDLSLQLGEGLELAAAEYNLGGVQRMLGQYSDAISNAEHALALEEKFGHVAAAARSMQLLGTCYHSMGELDKAADYYTRSIQASRTYGDFEATAILESNLAELSVEQGDLEKAAILYAHATHYFRAAALESALAYNLAGQAFVQFLRAQHTADTDALETANQEATEALALAQKIRSPETEGIAYRVLAALAAGRGDFAQAEKYIQSGIELLSRVGSVLELERARQTYYKIVSLSADETIHARADEFLNQSEKG